MSMEFDGAWREYNFCLLAVGIVLLAVLYGMLKRLGAGENPIGGFNRMHRKFFRLYVALSLLLIILESEALALNLAKAALGALIYAAFYYGLVVNFLALASVSISTSLLAILKEHGGCLRPIEIPQYYADGKGFNYIRETRLNRLVTQLGWTQKVHDNYQLTRKGVLMVRLTKCLLKLFHLKQLSHVS